MKEFFDNIFAWVKANIMLAVIIAIASAFIFFPRTFKKLLGTTPRRRRRRPLARSVGMYRRRRPATRRQYTKGGKAKKAWQIKGSLAARRHMARIRRMR